MRIQALVQMCRIQYCEHRLVMVEQQPIRESIADFQVERDPPRIIQHHKKCRTGFSVGAHTDVKDKMKRSVFCIFFERMCVRAKFRRSRGVSRMFVHGKEFISLDYSD